MTSADVKRDWKTGGGCFTVLWLRLRSPVLSQQGGFGGGGADGILRGLPAPRALMSPGGLSGRGNALPRK